MDALLFCKNRSVNIDVSGVYTLDHSITAGRQLIIKELYANHNKGLI